MFTVLTVGIIFLFLVGFLFVGRRVLRFAIKLAIAGVLILLLFVGAAVGWWRGWFGSTSRASRPTAQTNQRTNSNRRSSSH